jgi:hypothetical protein
VKIKAAMLATLLGLGVGSAQAQSRWADEPGYYEGLSVRAIVRAVRARGLVPVSRITRRGDLYYVNAADDYGRVRRVMVDAYSGRVVRIETATRPERGPGLPPMTRQRPRDDDDRGGYAMRPPGAIDEMPSPRVIPADPGPSDERLGPREQVRGLPPLRPRAGLSPDRPEPRASLGGLPPPPAPGVSRTGPGSEEPPPRPAEGLPRRERGRTAAVSPRHPPAPRPRPASPAIPEAAATPEPAPAPDAAGAPPAPAATPEPAVPAQAAVPPAPAEADAEPAPAKPAADDSGPTAVAPGKQKPLPRVILPGGPLPKAERTADTRPGRRLHRPSEASPIDGSAAETQATPAPPAPTDEKAAPDALPPVQGLD